MGDWEVLFEVVEDEREGEGEGKVAMVTRQLHPKNEIPSHQPFFSFKNSAKRVYPLTQLKIESPRSGPPPRLYL